MRENEALWALTEREKQTLRLIVRGHDAKSIARTLNLSVHTINERLRDARRKMAVSSSREAARLLLDAEDEHAVLPIPQLFGDTPLGDDPTTAMINGVRQPPRRGWFIVGGIVVLLALSLALAAITQVAPNPARSSNPEVVASARRFLLMVDEGHWQESYRATGRAFRKLNTAATWATVSARVRPPLGATITRTLLSQENLPAPPDGYEVVKFRTTFANKVDATETVSLDREDGAWRVVGVTIE